MIERESSESSPRDEEGLQATQGLPGSVAESGVAERTLLASEIRFRRLFETAKDEIFILDAETGRITEANPYHLHARSGWKFDIVKQNGRADHWLHP